MKRLHTHSQHFLRSPRFVNELIGHTSIKRNDLVYDIGAGSGVITSALAKKCRHVVAIEIDPKTAQLLKRNVGQLSNVSIIEENFLALPLPDVPYKIFANIPFHLSSAIVHKITTAKNPPTASYLIVQKQFANKLLPNHQGFSSQLGMILGPLFAIKVRKRLKRTDFWPFPNVDTVLLEIKHRDTPLIAPSLLSEYEAFIKKYFTEPVAFKKLNLKTIGRELGVKPSSLTLEDWIALFKNR